ADAGADGAGKHGQHDVEVDVERGGSSEGVQAEAADGLGEALFVVHTFGVALDEGLGGAVEVVGDQDGGVVVAQSGDGQLAHGGGVGRQADGGVVDDAHRAAGSAGPLQGDAGPRLGRQQKVNTDRVRWERRGT